MAEQSSSIDLNFRRLWHAFVNSPFSGIAPWILMSLMSGPGRFEASVAAALALSMVVTLSGHRRGTSFKLMEIFDLVFFAGFAIVGLVASPDVITFLELWAGEITNIALVVFALGTILLRQPFTLQYAKEETDEQYWDTPLFLHINYAITWVWAASFAVAAACGMYGDAVLKDSNNFWTGWILQIGAMVFAIAFTAFYPDYAKAKASGEQGPSKKELVEWLPLFILITGIVGLATDSVPAIAGGLLLAVGGVGEVGLILAQKKEAARSAG